MQHLTPRLARDGHSIRHARLALLPVAALALCLHACSGAPVTRANGVDTPAEADAGVVAPSIDLAARLAELEQHYSATEVENMLEALPALTPYFDDEAVTSGRAAALRHWEGLSPEDRATFADCLAPVMEYAAFIQELTADLPNGYHDVAFSLPESKVLYEPVLERYGLNAATASSYDVASSLSTFDDTSLQFALAELLCTLPERERSDYMQRFRAMADPR